MESNKSILKKYLLEACQASYVPNITKARNKILELPKEWLVNNINSVATGLLNLSDEWEYRRLLELYKMLDEELVLQLVSAGLKSSNPEVQEAAKDFSQD